MKKLLALLLAVCMIAAFAACGQPAEPDPQQPDDTQNDSVTVTDMSGAEVTIPLPVESVVNGWPASNSVMLLIGAGPLLTGTMQAQVLVLGR